MYKAYSRAKQISVMLSAVVIAVITAALGIVAASPSVSAETSEADKNSIYYFSDYDNSTYIKNAIERDLGVNIVFEKDTTYDTANEYVREALQKVEFNEIVNSYVIIEVRKPMDPELISGITYNVPYMLKDIFSALKENGCRTIFINGTDESRFAGYDDLFDYVDFQINTDISLTFNENIMSGLAAEFGNVKLETCTFIYGNGLVPGETILEKCGCEYMEGYFALYFKTVYEDDYRYSNKPFTQFLSEKMINVLCQSQEMSYYDMLSSYLVDLKDEWQRAPYFDVPFISAVNKTGAIPYDVASDWIRDTIDIRAELGLEFGIYVNNSGNYDLSEFFGNNVYFMGTIDENDVIAAIEEFIINDNPTENWSGRCPTYKPLSSGAGGWLVDLRSGGYDEFVVNLPLFTDDPGYFNYLYGGTQWY